jgi:energy-coupling factor transporter ATP-binding protein EcfA2
MHIKELTISNYKSFLDPVTFEFEKGFNVLLGANSSGKTTVLEAIEYHALQNIPHRSLLNIIEVDSVPTGASEVKVSLEINFEEVKKLFNTPQDFWVPVGTEDGNGFHSENALTLKEKFEKEKLFIGLAMNHQAGPSIRLGIAGWPTPWLKVNEGVTYCGAKYSFASGVFEQITRVGQGTFLQQTVWSAIAPRIYRFSAERSVHPTSGHHPNGDLFTRGENLAFCMNHLQTNNPALFDQLTSLIQRIFPNIHRVSAPPVNNVFELRVQTTPAKLNRSDLSVPIDKVGTGVGNALAMLYVALTSQVQRFILLEEPNSFLHPRALRELLAILAEIGGKHQFFITTHSSDVLRTINASTVTLLEHDGQKTSIKQTTGSRLHELRAGLIDLGIRLTDLHGCDEVIWVEGETEEAIFPKLLRYYFPEKAQGIAVLPLHSTGDFESKKIKTKKVAAIYKHLSDGTFLAPPMVAITLDREARSDADIQRIKDECGGIVHFLPKIMLEDFLLDANAIAAVLSHELNDVVTNQQVQEALTKYQEDVVYSLEPKNPKGSPPHAAKVLEKVFQELAKREYQKTSHGPQLTDWILVNKPQHFDELQDWFKEFLL